MSSTTGSRSTAWRSPCGHADGTFSTAAGDAGASHEGEILIRAPDAVPLLPRRRRRTGFAGPDGDAVLVRHRRRRALRRRAAIWPCPGRIDDVITTGAEKVWPDVVERVLSAHPDVAEVAVWKRSDPEWGERVVAWVVPTRRRPVARRTPPGGGGRHRSLGGAEGARHRRRPAAHGAGKVRRRARRRPEPDQASASRAGR